VSGRYEQGSGRQFKVTDDMAVSADVATGHSPWRIRTANPWPISAMCLIERPLVH